MNKENLYDWGTLLYDQKGMCYMCPRCNDIGKYGEIIILPKGNEWDYECTECENKYVIKNIKLKL